MKKIMKKIALIIGHSKESKGAKNKNWDFSEFEFNEPLVHIVAMKLKLEGFDVDVIYRTGRYFELPFDVNKSNADVAVSFHCNAFNGQASGSEVLYYSGSKKGKLLAQCLQSSFVWENSGTKDRGVKPVTFGQRGGNLLKCTSMPCVIAEPFFIDNDESFERFINLTSGAFEALATAYAVGIANYFEGS